MKETKNIIAVFCIGFLVGAGAMRVRFEAFPSTTTYQRSSDSGWERSDIQMPDTAITDTLVFGRDTVYPTTIYKNFKSQPK